MKPQKPSTKSKTARTTTKKAPGRKTYELRLYVAGLTARSSQAIAHVKKICEDHLRERYNLQVTNIYQHKVLAKGEQILAAPTLIKKLPLPLRRIIGDMTNSERVLVGLDLRPGDGKPPRGN